VVSALVMYLGGHAVLRGTWTGATTSKYNMFLVFMIARGYPDVNIGTQLTEAFAGWIAQRDHVGVEENQTRPARFRCRRFKEGED